MKHLLYLLLFMLVSVSAYANELSFDNFSVEDGLNHEVVRGIVQGPSGFLWIATEGGLVRFDGFKFVEFRYAQDDQPVSNVLSDIALDDEGRIWLGTLGSGLLRFDPINHTFLRVLPDTLASSQVSKIFIDSNGQIWVGTLEDGLNLIKVVDGELTSVDFQTAPNGISHPSVTAFAEDNLGRIWIGTDGGGVDIYQPATKAWMNLSADEPQQNPLSGNRVRSLFIDNVGDVWIGTASSGLSKYLSGEKRIEYFGHDPNNSRSLGNNRVLDIFQDDLGKLWVGTDGGISIFSDGQFENIKSQRFKNNSLSHNRVLSIYQDNAGLMWFGTYNGLNKWNPATSFFNHNIPHTLDELDHTNVLDFATDSLGQLYVATYGGGVAILNTQGDWRAITSADGLPDNRIVSLMVDEQDGLWVGTRSEGLWYRPFGSQRWQTYKNEPGDPNSLPANGITDILQDSRGDIWVSTYSGGISRRVEAGFISFLKTPADESADKSGLSSKNVFQILEDKDGLIWLASDNGLNMVSPDGLTVEQFLPDQSSERGLKSELTSHIFEDNSGNFWIGTTGHGVYIWDYKDRLQKKPVFRHVTTRDGLPHDTVYGVQQDTAGNVWLSTARGLAKMDPNDFSITSFNVSHGLQGYDYNLGASFADTKGNIYFGGTNGYNRFRAEEIQRNQTPPKVTLLNISTVDNRIQLPLTQNVLELDYSDYLVAFDFVALDFVAPHKNQYQYRLEPFDQNWIFVGNLRRATYTNLPSGSYTFRVRAANNDGFWSGPQINLPIKVTPAPWKTPLAYSIYTLLILFSLFLFLRNQMKKLTKEELHRKQLEVQVAERTAELASQNKVLTELNIKLERANNIDSLTGCKNRTFLENYLKKAIPDYDQPSNKGVMLVLLIDLDNVMELNDSLGHAAGDALIGYAAAAFAEHLDSEFNLVRWGWDEFMVVGHSDSPQESLQQIRKLKDNIERSRFNWLDSELQLSCSMGFAHYPFERNTPQAISWDQVTMIADKALYAAKKHDGVSWCGVMSAKREINELYLSELLHCQRITQVEDLVEITQSH